MPWVQIDFNQRLYINRVAIQFRKDCCYDRTTDVSVRVGDTATTGGSQVVTTTNAECCVTGPINKHYQMMHCSPTPIMGRYMTFQKTVPYGHWELNEVWVWHLV